MTTSRRSMLRCSGAAMLAAAASRFALARPEVAVLSDLPKDEVLSDRSASGSMGAGHTQFLTTADGRVLCFAQWGRRDGFPVVTLHGSPGSRFISRRAEALMHELRIRLITYDRPGYGHSTRRGPNTRVVDHVGDVR